LGYHTYKAFIQGGNNMQKPRRIWEIDFIRGLAIILMVVFHLVFDLKEYYAYSLDYGNGFWFYVGKAAAVLFILVCGISSTFGRSSFRHGLVILSWGMVLTLVTYFYAPAVYIRFGILHLLGISLLSYRLIYGLQPALLFSLSAVILIIGRFSLTIPVSHNFFLPFGLTSSTFASLDYYPLLPWYGVFLIGVAAGKTLYSKKETLLAVNRNPNSITYLGRHSLLIYLIHQPILIAGLYVLHKLHLI